MLAKSVTKEAQCWFKQEYMKSNPSQDPGCKEIFVNGQTPQRKGKVTDSPRAKVKAKARTRENIQEKGATTRTRLDLRMKMESARWVILVVKRQRVEFVDDVQENDDFETPRLDRAA